MTILTSTIGVKFANELNDLPAERVIWQCRLDPRWSRRAALRMYDVWYVAADGKSARRLTKGREQKLQFRVTTLDGRGGGGPGAGGPPAAAAQKKNRKRSVASIRKTLYLRAEHQENARHRDLQARQSERIGHE